MFGLSYLAINQLFTAAAVGPNSPLKAIFPVMSARDFYRDAAAMGGVPHLDARYGPTPRSTGCSTLSTRRWR